MRTTYIYVYIIYTFIYLFVFICTHSIQGRREIISQIIDYINGSDDRPLALYGYSGSGKTYLMAQTACILKEKYNLQIF